MIELLKIIHFLSFSVAIGSGVANIALGIRQSSFPPEAMPPLGGFRILLGKISSTGLILLWITGIWLVVVLYGSAVFGDTSFLIKLGAVLVLTVFSIMANVTVAKARKAGGPPNAQLMKRLGMGSQAMAILAVIFAVIAFS